MDFEALIRFSQVMPGADAELDLRVLKAHLLAEEALNSYIEFKAPRGKLLTEGRLSFSVKMNIAKAITEPGKLDWVWGAYDKLNKLRNSFAHELEDKKRSEKLDAFIESCLDAPQWKELSASFEDHLTLAIFMSCLELEHHVKALQRLRICAT